MSTAQGAEELGRCFHRLAYQAGAYTVLASQAVIDRLLDEESGNVADLEIFIERPIRFQVEPVYTQEQYDVVLM